MMLTVSMATHADHPGGGKPRERKVFERNLRTKRQPTQSHQPSGVTVCQCYCGLPTDPLAVQSAVTASQSPAVSAFVRCRSISHHLSVPHYRTTKPPHTPRLPLRRHGPLCAITGLSARTSESQSRQLPRSSHIPAPSRGLLCVFGLRYGRDTQQSLTFHTHSLQHLAQ